MIIWKLKEEIIDKQKVASEIKVALEGLEGKIDGLIKMNILTEKLESSSGDVMMDSTFRDEKALKEYQKHPMHVEIANGVVRPNVEVRLSYDYQQK